MSIPVGQGLAVWRFLVDGDSEEMVSTCGVDLSGAAGDFQEVAEDLRSIFLTDVLQEVRNTSTFRGVYLYVGQDGGASAVFEAPDSTPGPASSPGLPSNCALLVNKPTAQAGRRNRGRFYWPCMLAEASVDQNGNLIGGEFAAKQAVFDAFYDKMANGFAGQGAAPTPPLLFHQTGDQTPTPVTAFNVQPKIATQRQRMRR